MYSYLAVQKQDGLKDLAATAQGLPKGITIKELAKSSKLSFEVASQEQHWTEPTEPIKIVGLLYFVGTLGLGSWFFVTMSQRLCSDLAPRDLLL